MQQAQSPETLRELRRQLRASSNSCLSTLNTKDIKSLRNNAQTGGNFPGTILDIELWHRTWRVRLSVETR